jgi:butyrate kinase
MASTERVLAINPGSTSTKIALYQGSDPLFEKTLRHPAEELESFGSVAGQLPFRRQVILDALAENGTALEAIDAVVGRGGLTHPMEGGTYEVNDRLLGDLQKGVLGEHASNLGGILAHALSQEIGQASGREGVRSFIVDPVVVDELDPLARLSGLPEIPRVSIFHALNQKAVARLAAGELSRSYESCNFVVAHLGGGITVGAHRKGRVVDVNDGLNGEGPFSPERSGGVPALPLARLCFAEGAELGTIKSRLKGRGGMAAYLGTSDAREVSRRVEEGEKEAALVFEAMAYQVAKEIGAMATVLEGEVDGILITGGVAYDERFVEWIRRRVEYIAPVMVFPGENELAALAAGALRVLRGKEEAKVYHGESGRAIPAEAISAGVSRSTRDAAAGEKAPKEETPRGRGAPRNKKGEA